MKTLLFAVALVLLSAASAMGQATLNTYVLSNEPIKVHEFSHPEHATQQPMAEAQNLLENANYSYAVGKRPLWEFASKQQAMPLGDVARLLRKQHETAKKSSVVYEN
jgi:hypothetical protein